MKLLRSALACFALAVAFCSACHAQSFPGRDGHWEATVKSAGQQPITQEFCLNNDTWKRAIFSNKSCTVSQVSSTLGSATYHMECNMPTLTMKGDTKINFDGKEHMTSTAKFNMVMQGKPSSFESTVDYRWKTAACTGNEMNLRADKSSGQKP